MLLRLSVGVISAIFSVALHSAGVWAADPASQDGPYLWELRLYERALGKVSKLTPTDPCREGGAGAKPSCSSITDRFCKKLWDPAVKGNADLLTGKFRFGKSNKSEMSMIEKIDNEALVASAERLPPDIRDEASQILRELAALLKKEEDSKPWYRRLGKLKDQFAELVVDKAQQRTERRLTRLKKIKAKDLTVEEEGEYTKDSIELRNQILEAKYSGHPNWLRVKRVFEGAKKDLTKAIHALKIDDPLKAKLLRKIETVRLSLPYNDPRILFSDEPDCANVNDNAYYVRRTNVLTVCAGMFNSMQSDPALYFVIAHEIGHSIDPSAMAEVSMMGSEVGRVLGRLCNARGAAIPCNEWARIRREVLISPPSIPERKLAWNELSACLRSEAGLTEFKGANLRSAAKERSLESMSEWVSDQSLSKLAQPVFSKDGRSEINQYYLRPDRLRASKGNGLFFRGDCGRDVVPELFTQILSCENYAGAPAEKRAEVFSKALAELQSVQQVINENWYSHCGRECDDLVNKNLSRLTKEDFADWIAGRAFSIALREETSNVKRIERAASAGGFACSGPAPAEEAADLAAIENRYSFEEHPDDRKRRLSVFTPEVIQLVGCEEDAEIEKGSGRCDL